MQPVAPAAGVPAQQAAVDQVGERRLRLPLHGEPPDGSGGRPVEGGREAGKRLPAGGEAQVLDEQPVGRKGEDGTDMTAFDCVAIECLVPGRLVLDLSEIFGQRDLGVQGQVRTGDPERQRQPVAGGGEAVQVGVGQGAALAQDARQERPRRCGFQKVQVAPLTERNAPPGGEDQGGWRTGHERCDLGGSGRVVGQDQYASAVQDPAVERLDLGLVVREAPFGLEGADDPGHGV
ncbi:hypothetical protein [Candidatus Thiodictyon syntrophicum]|jgi:hypothetical protein|uniref:Uncharacterized protein n=1 Tax=Candidatus Thiodictyon syntrophicum TaxID=1166950 RepID=A0A2K8UFM9_9GAMM|nr:hypothetical protein [Candidatus Thiodictyon syntrophicum]AUB84394.1 hypothetical protein THSYN_27965 [Candidatus Thiodictyon syntrophicum]